MSSKLLISLKTSVCNTAFLKWNICNTLFILRRRELTTSGSYINKSPIHSRIWRKLNRLITSYNQQTVRCNGELLSKLWINGKRLVGYNFIEGCLRGDHVHLCIIIIRKNTIILQELRPKGISSTKTVCLKLCTISRVCSLKDVLDDYLSNNGRFACSRKTIEDKHLLNLFLITSNCTSNVPLPLLTL